MTRSDGLTRYLATMFRRYSRDPATRTNSARHLMVAAICLCAEHNGLGEASLMAAEALAELKREVRQQESDGRRVDLQGQA